MSPRRNVNPAARRRTIALFGVALLLLAGMVFAATTLGPRGTVRLPELRGLSRSEVNSRLHHLHLRAAFAASFSQSRPDTAVAQTPGAGVRVKDGSTVRVVLSKGLAPVPVPQLVGDGSSTAQSRLKQLKLNASITTVPAPGTAPGIVTRQSPAAGDHLQVRSTVALFVAEAPTWREVTSLSGSGSGHSVVFRIRGSQWRVVYTMSYQGTCDFVFFCNGPNAQVLGLGANATQTSFGLNDGGQQSRVFKSGAGLYQIAVKPGWDSATWSIEVDDYY